MSTFSTPMMKQYIKIKKQYPDCLLLFRLGDFYELFMDDAKLGSKILGITLTARHKGRDGKIPMAGVPYHALDSYLGKLIKAGHKVAICEQVTEPNKAGIVEREVVRIATPGTVLDEKILEKNHNNYIVNLLIKKQTINLAVADVSTGDFQVIEVKTNNIYQELDNQLSRIQPTECILPENHYNNPLILKTLKKQSGLNIYCFHDWENFAENAREVLKKHFKVQTLKVFKIDKKTELQKTTASLLGYLQYTQKNKVSHIKKIRFVQPEDHTLLDRSTIINLELFSTIHNQEKKGSLIYHLDQTITPMGARMLRQWLIRPLRKKDKILKRLETVKELINNRQTKNKIRELLKQVSDLERILSRLTIKIGNARDLISLKNSLINIVKIKREIKTNKLKSDLIIQVSKSTNQKIDQIIKNIEKTIIDNPPVDIKQGGLIKTGNNQELDDLRQKIGGGKKWITKLEAQEKKRTNINSLKIKFNRVFGYYIEISKANIHLVPSDYIRKQTLVNAERFITPELKEQEDIILTAEEKINQIEYQLFINLVNKILKNIRSIQHLAKCIAVFDCLLSFAQTAEKENYSQPELTTNKEIKIEQGRHPVVEKLLDDNQFVPNNLELNNKDQQLIIITGPNMAGKSVYIRQTALIVLMAQIGSFVPAKKAKISIIDRIFVRSGASDVITSGLSTFMVEMVEAAYILNNATQNSLIILDEIGRGTSTYDGISIAWAIAQYLVTKSKKTPKTLFATHYHELQELEKQYSKIKNYQVAIKEKNGQPIFLHKVISGGASHSYGIAVADLAGVPKQVITQAKNILATLENRQFKTPKKKMPFIDLKQKSLFEKQNHQIINKLKKIDVNQLTPIEALNKLVEIKEKINNN